MNVSASSEQGMTLHNESSSKKMRCAGLNFLTPRLLVAVTMGRKLKTPVSGSQCLVSAPQPSSRSAHVALRDGFPIGTSSALLRLAKYQHDPLQRHERGHLPRPCTTSLRLIFCLDPPSSWPN